MFFKIICCIKMTGVTRLKTKRRIVYIVFFPIFLCSALCEECWYLCSSLLPVGQVRDRTECEVRTVWCSVSKGALRRASLTHRGSAGTQRSCFCWRTAMWWPLKKQLPFWEYPRLRTASCRCTTIKWPTLRCHISEWDFQNKGTSPVGVA